MRQAGPFFIIIQALYVFQNKTSTVREVSDSSNSQEHSRKKDPSPQLLAQGSFYYLILSMQ